MEKALVVSIHDVSPFTRPDCERMLADLQSARIATLSLLVIPDHHGRGHFLADAGFCQWLRELEAAGNEIVIHGFTHQRARMAGESLADQAMTRFYTRDEGEFFDIAENQAAELIARAQRDFTSAGLSPVGFIAPAWLLSEGGERAARAAGCAYTTRLGTVTDFRRDQTHKSQSLVYSVPSAWRRAASLAWNPLLARHLRDHPLMRLGLHPPDIRHSRIWRQILRLTRTAAAERKVTTYAGWLHTSQVHARIT